MWARLDDNLLNHPKVLAAGAAIGGKSGSLLALGLCSAGILYSCRHLTDGFLPAAIVAQWTYGLARAREAMCLAGLWKACAGGYHIHDFTDWNFSAEKVKQLRQRKASAGRCGGLAKARQASSTSLAPASASAKQERSISARDPYPKPTPKPDSPEDGGIFRARGEPDGDLAALQRHTAPTDAAAECYERFRERAAATGRGTLPLTPRSYDALAAIDLVTRYPDQAQRAQLVEDYLASTHRPLRAQPISMGQLAKWAAWLEDHRTRAPAVESDEEFVAKALAMKGPLS